MREWGVAALERAARGLKCKTAVHICYGYGIKPNIEWKQSLGTEWRQYEKIFPYLAASNINQISVERMHSRVPISLIGLAISMGGRNTSSKSSYDSLER